MEVKVDEGMQGGNGAHWERIQWWAAHPRKIRGFKVIQGCSRLNFFSPTQRANPAACRRQNLETNPFTHASEGRHIHAGWHCLEDAATIQPSPAEINKT